MITALLFGATYSLLGIALLVVGFYVIDALTPGRLGSHLTETGSINAGLVVAAEFLGVGAIVFTTIWTNADAGFGPALGWTAAFGLLGIALQAVSFVILDAVTPGSLREIAVSHGLHPAAIVAAAAQLAVSAIVVASIA